MELFGILFTVLGAMGLLGEAILYAAWRYGSYNKPDVGPLLITAACVSGAMFAMGVAALVWELV